MAGLLKKDRYFFWRLPLRSIPGAEVDFALVVPPSPRRTRRRRSRAVGCSLSLDSGISCKHQRNHADNFEHLTFKAATEHIGWFVNGNDERYKGLLLV